MSETNEMEERRAEYKRVYRLALTAAGVGDWAGLQALRAMLQEIRLMYGLGRQKDEPESAARATRGKKPQTFDPMKVRGI